MPTLMIRAATAVATVDAEDRVLAGVDVLVRDGVIERLAPRIEASADLVLEGRDRLVVPGLVNTHHHSYQSLTRVVSGVQDAPLFDWLLCLYETWRGLTPEAVYGGARLALAELLLSGCTTAADHYYVFPSRAPRELLDETIRAASELGIRFHPTRGSMSLGRSAGGLPPDDVVQTETEILADCERVIDRYHDPSPGSMCRVGIAPCSPFSVTEGLMRDAARLARDRAVLLHTHLAETLDEERFCLERTGKRPLAYAEALGWLGEDVWFAHGVHFDEAEIRLLGETRTGIAHCPVSNMRLASGIAPVPALLEAGARVGLAVDGSASNDSGNLLREAQAALLVHRLRGGASAMTAPRALRLATRGGAEVLGRDELGSIEPGKRADLALYRLDDIGFAGALHDPVAALLFCCGAMRAETVVVEGRVVVERGRLVTADQDEIFREGDRLSRALLGTCGSH